MEITYKESEIREVAKKVLKRTPHKTFVFHAPMGAGKTTLIKGMLRELDAADTGNSPTFGIVNEYHDLQGGLLAYHFDFYRLNEETEAFDLGLEEYLSQDVWIFIEWPEKIGSFLPDDAIHIYIEIIDNQTRRLV